ncbi:syntaxin-5-like [Anomaloglossus baeobatrachus]
MNARKRHCFRNTENGVYVGPPQTQVLPSQAALEVLPPPSLVPPTDNMSCRDRTDEFMSACKSLRGRQNGVPLSNPSLNAVKQRSELTLMAKRIGKDLSNTFTKLEKLTILAKRKSLFDDKAVEIEELTYIIKQDINSLNQQIAQLQSFVRARGSQSGRHVQTHSKGGNTSMRVKSVRLG